jgi:aminoglycoside phosphotransferase (APT) family kinase protein
VVDVEVDVNVLERRLAGLRATDLRPLPGGASSLSYVARADVDGRVQRVVVKVAPAGLAPVRNRDVLRQARLLRRLRGTTVPVPEVLWEDPGAPPEVPPLFVMRFVEGTSHEPLFDRDARGADTPDVVAERMDDAARVLAALHALDPCELGLGEEPSVDLTDEIERWVHVLRTVDPALVPGWEGVAEGLRVTQPPPLPPAVVHGDFRLGNLLASGPTITAVVDWEIWSIGDPRVDLGWFLVNADPETYHRDTGCADRLPTPDALARTYAGGRDVPALGWFQALACFKSAATWALIVKHNRRRAAPDPVPEEVAPVLPGLLARAGRLLP